jgi:hypothetical protein
VIRNNAVIELIVDFGTAVIWAAFTVEFVVMVSIVKKRVRYCKEHWIDLAIILAPMLAFARLMRIGRLMRLQVVARTTRVYRLRGLAMRAYQAIFFIEIIQKVFQGKPEKRLVRLEEQLAEKQDEVCEIKEEIARVREEIARRETQQAQAAEDAEQVESQETAAKDRGARIGDDTVPIVDQGSETLGTPNTADVSDDSEASPSVIDGAAGSGREVT